MNSLNWTYEEKLCYIAHIWTNKEKLLPSLQDFDYTDMAKAAIEFIGRQPNNVEFTKHIENCFSELNKECIDENSRTCKNLAWSVNDEKSIMESPSHAYIMVLCMVELGDGVSLKQIPKMLSLLSPEKRYLPVEFHAANTSAYGYIESEYYEEYHYASDFLENIVLPVIDDKILESPDGIYGISDGRYFYMGYFND